MTEIAWFSVAILTSLVATSGCSSDVQIEGGGGVGAASGTGGSGVAAGSGGSGGEGATGGEGLGGAPPDLPCLGLVQVGQAEPLLENGYPSASGLSKDGLLVASRGGYARGNLELHWFDPWSTWPPIAVAERAFGMQAKARLTRSVTNGVAASIYPGVLLQLDITPDSDGYVAFDTSGESNRSITRVGDEYFLVTSSTSPNERTWWWADSTGAIVRQRSESICPSNFFLDPSVVRAPSGTGTWVATEARGEDADCDDFADHPLGLYIVDDGPAQPIILDESSRYLSVQALVGAPGALGIVFGRYRDPGPQSNRRHDLFFMALQDDGTPRAAPQPLLVTGDTTQPSAVVPVANGFLVGRFLVASPGNAQVAIARFDLDGNPVEELLTDTISLTQANDGIVAHRSLDGRSILLVWRDNGEPPIGEDGMLMGVRFDCVIR